MAICCCVYVSIEWECLALSCEFTMLFQSLFSIQKKFIRMVFQRCYSILSTASIDGYWNT